MQSIDKIAIKKPKITSEKSRIIISNKNLARIIASQILYQFLVISNYDNSYDISSYDFISAKKQIFDEYLVIEIDCDLARYYQKNRRFYQDDKQDFINNLLAAAISNYQELNNLITINLDKNNILALDKLIIAITIIACCELKFSDHNTKTVINNYIKIANCFFDDDKVKFINAIIDKIANKILTDNIIK
jgi:transcription termination factor NusB